jgi:hypothetical protein
MRSPKEHSTTSDGHSCACGSQWCLENNKGNLRQAKLTRTQSKQQLMDMVNELAHCTTELGRSTSPAAEVMLAWVDDDGPIKQGRAAAAGELLLEVVCKLSTRDESGCLHICCLVRRKVLLQSLAGVVATDIKGGRCSSLEWAGRFA